MFARFQNRDLRVISAKIGWKLNEATDFEVTVPLQEVPDILTARMEPIDIYERGQLLISGFVNDTPEIDLEKDKTLSVKMNAFGELGWLTQYRAKSNSHYQDQQLLDILDDLLLVANGAWDIGDISTMVDATIETTIDLRSKEEVFAQIVAAIKNVPDVHIRYGGYSGGIHYLDVGNFNQVTQHFTEGHNLQSLKRKRISTPFYSVVEAYGNWSGSEDVLSLQNALADARTTAHPDYTRFPITYDAATGTWICSDTVETKGVQVTKTFSLTKTSNDEPPTATEIAEAGYALWLKTVRFLKSHTEHEEFSGDIVLPAAPRVGDKARIHSVIWEPVIDHVERSVEYIQLYTVDDSYRITEVDYEFETAWIKDRSGTEVTDEDANLYSFSVTSNDEAERVDPELELYERLEQADKFDSVPGSLGFLIPSPVTVTYGPLDAADCDYDGVSPGTLEGKLYTFTSPSAPNWANHCTVKFDFDDPDVVYRVVQTPEPNSPGDDLILCVKTSSGVDWPPAADVTGTAQFVFTK